MLLPSCISKGLSFAATAQSNEEENNQKNGRNTPHTDAAESVLHNTQPKHHVVDNVG